VITRSAMLASVLLGAGMLLPGCSSSGEVVLGPAWNGPRLNTGSRMNYPAAALNAGVTGVVMVACTVTETRELRDCRAARETPTGWGFGEAAVRMHQNVRVPPATPSGPAFFTVPFCMSPESCDAQTAISEGWRREMRMQPSEGG
jgi:TonB family protein